jgi:hypothetical protein
MLPRNVVWVCAALLGVALMLTFEPTEAAVENASTPGEVTTPYPTIIHLAVEWKIQGDDNLNGMVTVQFRETARWEWHQGLPLRRVPAGKSQETHPIFNWENKYSGSLFDLKPDTEYEIKLKLSDPDGGSAEKTVRARTRPIPRVPAKAPVVRGSPGKIPVVRAGQIVLLAPGNYGSFTPAKDGEPGKPIVYRSAQGGAIFKSVSLRNRKHVYLEGLTIQNPDKSEGSFGVDLVGAEECVVRRCTIRALYGVRAPAPPGAKNCYIGDNFIRGFNPWTADAMGANGKNLGEGIEITGPGNVICFNRVSGFRDCLSTMEDTWASEQVCVDFYNNDIYSGLDDGIEADFCMGNCRIVRNRLTNCFTGLSSQPGLGGPTYFIRNVMYNLTHVPFKLNRFSRGDVCLHNTVVKGGDGMACFAGQPFDHAYFRNNLCIGGPPGSEKWGDDGSGTGQAVNLVALGPHCDFDYDGVGTYQTAFKGSIGAQQFSSVEEMRKGPHEKHGVKVGMSVFKGVLFPEKPVPELEPQDLRPVPGSPVVDAGLRLPNINDEFLGDGPDVGAYEAGQELPIYGPRPEGVDEETDYAHRGTHGGGPNPSDLAHISKLVAAVNPRALLIPATRSHTIVRIITASRDLVPLPVLRRRALHEQQQPYTSGILKGRFGYNGPFRRAEWEGARTLGQLRP